MARTYPNGVPHKVLDLLDAGHSVTTIAHDQSIAGRTHRPT